MPLSLFLAEGLHNPAEDIGICLQRKGLDTLIVHIPHDGDIIPDRYADFIGTPISLRDIHATELYYGCNGDIISFPFNRLICDVERFSDASKECMEKVGMGVCYTKNAMLRPMRNVSDAQRQEIIETLYMPHHRRLERAVTREIERYGRCLIIDGHTFSHRQYPYMSDTLRPEICIGYGSQDERLGKQAIIMFNEAGYDVASNRPFSGALKPLRYIDDERVASIMFEIRQDVPVRACAEAIRRITDALVRQWY